MLLLLRLVVMKREYFVKREALVAARDFVEENGLAFSAAARTEVPAGLRVGVLTTELDILEHHRHIRRIVRFACLFLRLTAFVHVSV